jgi:hypothetical protein
MPSPLKFPSLDKLEQHDSQATPPINNVAILDQVYVPPLHPIHLL